MTERILSCLKWFSLVLVLAGASCHGQPQDGDKDGPDIQATQTPVTVTEPVRGPIADMVTLNATSSFLKKNGVKSSVNGYVTSCGISPGEWVRSGQTLFVLKTREAEAIGSGAATLDSTLGFSGTITVRAPQAGFISDLSHQQGDYVADGDALCTIADKSSFVFLLDVPVELDSLVIPGASCRILLPDGRAIPGRILSMLPSVDPASQTQRCEIQPLGGDNLPEGLVAKVQLVRKKAAEAILLPRGAVLSDETMSSFWIMTLINDTTAVKVPVVTGISRGDSIQILSPPLASGERILVTGNYGLGDTALVRVQNSK